MGDALTEGSEVSLRQVPCVGAEVTLFLSMLEDSRALTRDAVKGLNEEDLQRIPPQGQRPVGRLLQDIAKTELWWIRECFGGAPAPEELWRAAGRTDDGAELPLAPTPASAYLADLERIRHETRVMLEISRDSALESFYAHPRDPGRHAQGRWILYHVLQQEAFLRGQIAAARTT